MQRHGRHTVRILTLTLALATVAAQAPAPAADSARRPRLDDASSLGPRAGVSSDLIERLERARLVGDREELTACREQLAARLEANSRDTGARYTLAYIDWRLVHLPGTEDRDALLERAQQALELNVEQSPDDVESRALLSAVLGERIGEMPIRGMVLGPQADAHMRRAADVAPDNPRVVLQQGVGALFKPAMFGGSVERAEERLRRARALFAEQPEDAPWPSWGRVDALGWLGHALVRQERYDEARAVYEQALALEPNAAFITEFLLPELEAAEAE